jgi:single-stranded-DNA-specific exonuclease
MHSWVQECADSLEHFGGHETALGCGVHRARFEEFSTRLNSVASLAGDDFPALEQILADDYLPLAEATPDAARWLVHLGPYGNGFPSFQFYVGPVEVVDVSAMGNGRHLRLTVREGKTAAQLIWFHPPAWAFSIETGSFVGAVASLELNTWQGRERAQLRVVSASVLSTPLTREDFAAVYRVLRERRKLQTDEIALHFPTFDEHKTRTVFDTFVDLGFAYQVQSAYHVVEQAQSCDLRESLIYQRHLRDASQSERSTG